MVILKFFVKSIVWVRTTCLVFSNEEEVSSIQGLNEGIKKTYQWFQENIDNLKQIKLKSNT